MKTSGRKKRILIVEDSRDLQALLVRFFSSEGYEADCASNGQEALDRLLAAGAERPDLILLDVMMPVMDGLEFRRRQLADADFASIPVVVMTAGSASAASDRALQMQASILVRKPIDDLDALLAAVEMASR